MNYRLWVSEDRLTLVRVWDNGTCEIAMRLSPWVTWGPPIQLTKESITQNPDNRVGPASGIT